MLTLGFSAMRTSNRRVPARATRNPTCCFRLAINIMLYWATGAIGSSFSRIFPHTIRGRCYCVKNLYATINATMPAKISSAGSEFRIIGLVEWRAADRLG